LSGAYISEGHFRLQVVVEFVREIYLIVLHPFAELGQNESGTESSWMAERVEVDTTLSSSTPATCVIVPVVVSSNKYQFTFSKKLNYILMTRRRILQLSRRKNDTLF
jgi:hypothetical protein